jgi:hypothetical protein
MKRIFLDTNIYIIGQLQPNSSEEIILSWLGFYQPLKSSELKVIISQELINQILRVSKRIQGKDWGSKIVDQIWLGLQLDYDLDIAQDNLGEIIICNKIYFFTQDVGRAKICIKTEKATG